MFLAGSIAACEGSGSGRAGDPKPAVAPESERSPDSKPEAKPADPHRPHFVEADPEAPIRDQIQAARKRADADGKILLVYVGAVWCEPCTAFHDAVEAGRFDEQLADLRMLEFDADRDGKKLADAGYTMKMIPALIAPYEDGTASELRLEGGIKGDGAADHVLQRLQPLLSRYRQMQKPS